MPEQRLSLPVERLRFGVIPVAMEEKWIVFWEPLWLHLHRSWSGHCICQVWLEPTVQGARIAEGIANHDPARYNQRDDADVSRRLLDSIVRRNARYLPAR